MTKSKNSRINKANTTHDYAEHQILELQRCISDPVYFISTYIKAKHPALGLIPMGLRPYQHRMIDAVMNNRNTIVLSARQTGKTAAIIGYLMWYAMFTFDRTILIASNKNSSAMESIHKIRTSYESLPNWMKPGVTDDGWNKHGVSFDNGTRIISETTSPTSGRGLSISVLYLDEFAFVHPTVQEEFWGSISPTLATGGSCIITSTPNGDKDIFSRLWRGAQSNANGFKPIFVNWDEAPDRDDEFKRTEIGKIGEQRWLQEYECVDGDTFVTIRDRKTKKIIKITMSELYERIKSGSSQHIGKL